jgi:hypothetical protein
MTTLISPQESVAQSDSSANLWQQGKLAATSKLRAIYLLVCCLGALTVLFALWPVYRAFLNIEIDGNEGWNAYHADAAMGRMPLYPAPDQLITNNYPPLSFYIVGGLGWLIGDPVLAGRLLSLASLALVAGGIFVAIKRFGGSALAASVGLLYFLATMTRFFTGYVGMNDPHLLGLGVMTLGFIALLRAVECDRGYAPPILLMVAAGFIKHNIIAMPLTGLVWLSLQRQRRLAYCGLFATGAIAFGFALCYGAYGPDFFTNLFSPRGFNWRHSLGGAGHLQWVAVGLLAWLYVGFVRRSDSGVQLCSLLIALGLLSFFVQKTGEGVAHNAQFELVLGVSIGVGIAFARVPLLPLARRYSRDALRIAFLVVICLRLLASSRLEPVRLLTDRRFHEEIAARESAMQATIQRIKLTPGDVACSSLLACFRSGKPFVVDNFNSVQRMRAGKLPPDAIQKLTSTGRLAIVPDDPILTWSMDLRNRSNPTEPAHGKSGLYLGE